MNLLKKIIAVLTKRPFLRILMAWLNRHWAEVLEL
jgi:hypothetical protein